MTINLETTLTFVLDTEEMRLDFLEYYNRFGNIEPCIENFKYEFENWISSEEYGYGNDMESQVILYRYFDSLIEVMREEFENHGYTLID